MDVLFTTHFERSYHDVPAAIKRAFDKQLAFLLDNLRHPSLRAKKYDAERWQARITRDWHFYFRIEMKPPPQQATGYQKEVDSELSKVTKQASGNQTRRD